MAENLVQGEDILEKVIVGRVPHIYAFKTLTIPAYLKVGDTHRPIPMRLEEWRRIFGKLEEVPIKDNAATADESGDIFFRDHSVHKYLEREGNCERLEKDSPHVVGKTDADGKPLHYSSEFFILKGAGEAEKRQVPIAVVQNGINDVREAYRAKVDKGYRYYDTSSLAIEDLQYASSGWWELRPNQDDVVRAFVQARKEGKTNLLMYAVMRFGKSFTAMSCARMMNGGHCEKDKTLADGQGAKLVVVVSGKKDVLDEWKKTVESPDNFRDDYKFMTADDLKSPSALSEVLDGKDRKNRAVVFLTLQDLTGDVIKDKHKNLFGREIDLLIVDETHFGARAEKQGKVLKRDEDVALKKIKDDEEGDDGKCDGDVANEEIRKRFDAKVRLHLSGTPYRILMGSEFRQKDGAVIAYCQFADIAKAQEEWDRDHLFFDDQLKEDNTPYKEWDNPYFGFPQMVRFAFTPNQSSLLKLKALKDSGVEYAFSELFRPQSIAKDKRGRHKKFCHEREVFELLKVVDGSAREGGLLGFLDHPRIKSGGMCRHVVCVLPYCASCDALETLIKRHRREFKNLGAYEIINISGADDTKTYAKASVVKDTIKRSESPSRHGARGRRPWPKKTLTLTVNKMLTGATVPEWDTMLYFKDTASPQEYDQAIFRLQSQYVKTIRDSGGGTIKVNMKPQTLLVDFDPDRLFKMQEKRSHFYNANTELSGNDKLRERIAEDLRISPIVRVNAETGLTRVEPSDIMDAVRKYSSERGIREEAQEIIVDIDELKRHPALFAAVQKQNPIDENKGIVDRPYGEGETALSGLDDPPTPPTDDDNGDEKHDKTEKEQDEDKQTLKRFHSYVMQVLFFAYLTPDRVTSLNEILAKIGQGENVRIATNLQMRACEIRELAALPPQVVHDIDYKVENINDLSHDKRYVEKPEERAEMAIRKIGKLGDSIIVTPSWVCRDMVDLIPDEAFHRAVGQRERFLDINGKTGEFATTLYRRFVALGYEVGQFDDLILTIPATKREYEFTLKVYRELHLQECCIAERFTAYDLVPRKNDDLAKHCARLRMVMLQDKNFNEISLEDDVSSPQEGESRMRAIGTVVGNPPYQDQNGSGGTNDAPIYQYFSEVARTTSLRWASLIVKSGWTSAGRENLLGWFRREMLSGQNVLSMTNYVNAADVFGDTQIKGGICHYLVDKLAGRQKCNYLLYYDKKTSVCEKRDMSDFDILIRDPRTDAIVKKVLKVAETNGEGFVSTIISADTPFGIGSNPAGGKKDAFTVSETKHGDFDTVIYYLKKSKRVTGFVRSADIEKNSGDINSVKVFIPAAYGAGEVFPHQILGQPELAPKKSVCSQTYLYAKFDSAAKAKNFISYLKTRFFRILVSACKITQHAQDRVYRFVPMQDFTQAWTDAKLYAKYGITKEEQKFIESMIKPME